VRILHHDARCGAESAHARLNPGHLSVEKVVAPAEAMGDNPLCVFLDLLTEAGAKVREKEKMLIVALIALEWLLRVA
jgi:hypothetical protein